MEYPDDFITAVRCVASKVATERQALFGLAVNKEYTM